MLAGREVRDRWMKAFAEAFAMRPKILVCVAREMERHLERSFTLDFLAAEAALSFSHDV